MMKQCLLSAPEEEYLEHIKRCKEKFELIFSVFEHTITRILDFEQTNDIKDAFYKMVIFHDLGKLTKKWQENVGTNKKLPAHSTIGAVYLWKILPKGIKEPLSFAVAIHHSDRGLLGDNIERPDVQAITNGITDFSGKIIFDEKTKELDNEIFPEIASNINIQDLKEMARGLRIWAKGCSIHQQHKKRMQASLAHHILKLCDISSATERKEYKKNDEKDYYGGWLMVENIKNYVNGINERLKQWV